MSEWSSSARRLERLRNSLALRLGDPDIVVERYRGGVDCWVDRVGRGDGTSAAVRSAKIERLETRYEGLVDHAVVLERDLLVTRLLREAGIPVPAVFAWHQTRDLEREPSWVLSEFIAHEPLERLPNIAHRSLGRLAREIHTIHPRGDDRRALAPRGTWSEWILNRLMQRIAAARRYTPLPDPDEVTRALKAALGDRQAEAGSLLHLDLRGPNLAVRGSEIVGVFDLSNAIVGDRYLELARVRGCGLLTAAFLDAYAEPPGELERHAVLLDAYELDLAALLTVVSREEFDDIELHARMAQRTRTLLERVLAAAA